MHEICPILNGKLRKRFGHKSLDTYLARISLPIRISQIIKKVWWNYLPRRCIPDRFHRFLGSAMVLRVGSNWRFLRCGWRLGVGSEYRRVNRSGKKTQSRTDELDARVTGEDGDKNRPSLAIPLPYANATSLASIWCMLDRDAKDCFNRGGTSGRTGR